MKKVLFFLVLLSATTVYAQDVIVKKDGTTILSKVIEIGTSEVKYKKFSNQNGPTYSVSKSELQAINYENGEKDTFESSPSANDNKGGLVNKDADANNADIIALHNHQHSFTKKVVEDDKMAKYIAAAIFWVSPTSVMSTNEIEISFEHQKGDLPFENSTLPYDYSNLVIKNKTDKYIYIDLGRTFCSTTDGRTRTYFDLEQTTISMGSSSGGGIGISVAPGVAIGGGGGRNNSVSTTYGKQRILSVPPHGMRSLSEERWVKSKEGGLFTNNEYTKVEEAEMFAPDGYFKGGTLKLGVTEFDESDSPYSYNYTIFYSSTEDFHSFSTLHANLYMKTLIGLKLHGGAKYARGADYYISDIDKNTIASTFYLGLNKDKGNMWTGLAGYDMDIIKWFRGKSK